MKGLSIQSLSLSSFGITTTIMALAGSSLFVVPKIHAFMPPHTLSVKAKSQSQGLHHPSDVNVGIKFHQYDHALKYSSGNSSNDKDHKSHASSMGKGTSADSSSSSSSTDISANTNMSEAVAERVKSVNYFISRECNYSCKFCFHTQKNVDKLELEDAKRGLKMLKDAGTEKINFAGGEPFINDILLGELCRYASESLNMAVSIISNASLIKPYWMKLYGQYVDVLGVSIDSFDDNVNAKIGRGSGAGISTSNSNGNGNDNGKNASENASTIRTVKNRHLERVLKVREMCEEQNIIFKMNTVVCSLNWEEDMSDYVQKLKPKRWKCFQVLILEDENAGGEKELRDARELVVSREQFDAFVQRHEHFDALIPEPNDVMQNSYLLLDENLCFLDCSEGGKVPSESILDVGVEVALGQAGFDHDMFKDRGGIYEWNREKGEAKKSPSPPKPKSLP